MMTLLESKLQSFLKSIPNNELAGKIKEFGEPCEESLAEVLALYANEARAALRMIEPFLTRNVRILEVGAGLCLLSFFLKQEGYDIIALEPATDGFAIFAHFQDVLANHYAGLHLNVLPCRADELQAERIGRFELIFSHNVLEHIPNLTQTLLAMLGVMEEHGRMVHSCPNYLIPYEPHFGVPVLKVAPALSRRLFWKRVTERKALWDSLNFITYPEVKKFAESRHLNVSFARGLLYEAIVRLGNDQQFRRRHGGLMMLSYLLLKYSGLLAVLKHLPPAFATPMTFVISRA